MNETRNARTMKKTSTVTDRDGRKFDDKPCSSETNSNDVEESEIRDKEDFPAKERIYNGARNIRWWKDEIKEKGNKNVDLTQPQTSLIWWVQILYRNVH